MRRAAEAVCILILALGWTPPCTGQALNLVGQLLERAGERLGPGTSEEAIDDANAAPAPPLALRDPDDAVERLRGRFQPIQPAALTRRFERLQGVDESLLAEFRSFPAAEQRVVVELVEEGERILWTYPGQGVSLLRNLNVPGLVEARLHGSAVPEGAAWLSTDEVAAYLRASPLTQGAREAAQKFLGGSLAAESLDQAQAVALWVSLFRKQGDGARLFWKNHIRPHRERWLSGNALLRYLIFPEHFHNPSGEVSPQGASILEALGIPSSGAAVEETAISPRDQTLTPAAGWPGAKVAVAVCVVVLILLAIPPVRTRLWRGPRRLWAAAWHPKDPGGYPRHQPLRE